MNKGLKKVLLALGVTILLHFVLVVTGNLHLYPTLNNTIFKGRFGPAIDEFQVFSNREVKANNHIAWPEKLNEFEFSEIESELHKELKTVAFVVVKDDTVRYEHYWDGYDKDSKSNSFSMAKSLVSIAIGAALQDGSIQSLDQTISDFIPEFEGGAQVTIRDLLMMNSGINFDEDYINPFAYPARANYGDDLWKLTLGYEYQGDKKGQFTYLSGNTQLLSFIINKATGKTLSDYFSENVWSKIGAKNDALWSLDNDNGYEKAFCCFNSNARDFARIGKLYLDSGKFNGEQIVPSWYVSESLKEVDLVEKNGDPCIRYGYQWWLTSFRDKKVFYARGILGQYILVIPEDEVIICRLGHKRIKPKGNEHPNEIYAYMEMAYRIFGENL
ncbi:MAG: serine hydrolase [Crocinitomicaceae bacterium]|nr:serine hydrolase [Crocinitomicaceae bacterium]|tara:strand:- start:9492 stop:10649 length:1158 start_codon:yes stop_codon:yes gene_type:complete